MVSLFPKRNQPTISMGNIWIYPSEDCGEDRHKSDGW